MENAVLIVILALLFCLGFIPVVMLTRFLRKNHRYITEDPARSQANRPGEGEGPLDEFENSGILYFESNDEDDGMNAENEVLE